MSKIVVERDDGGISIIIPADNIDTELLVRDAKAVAGYVSHKIVEDDELPSDRTYRNAWENGEKTVSVNMVKAREIQKDILRSMRAPLLENLDMEFLKALEGSDDSLKQEVIDKKQILRDVTTDPMISDAKTPEELKLAIPSCLLVEDEETQNGQFI